jgi:2-keto-4-pentenoate hydratase/2-oxohepta-3-ene-1,7-dioic acid hydratase in catechol pathway
VRIVVFGAEHRTGLLVDRRIVDINKAAERFLKHSGTAKNAQSAAAEQAPANLLAFIEAGDAALDLAEAAAAHVLKDPDDACVLDSAATTLHAPWPRRRIICAGANFPDHIANAMTHHGKSMTEDEAAAWLRGMSPLGFWKNPIEVAACNDSLAFPKCVYLDYEAEVAVVFAKGGKALSADEWTKRIWGVTLFSDWSIRDKETTLAAPLSLNLMKNFDGSVQLGPFIAVREVAPTDVEVKLTVDGKVRQNFKVSRMVRSFGEFAEYISRNVTLAPGDLLASGTGAGTAADNSPVREDGTQPLELFLKVGQHVEISSPQLGQISARIVAG